MNKDLVMTAIIGALLCVGIFWKDDDMTNRDEAIADMEEQLWVAYNELKRNAVACDDEVARLYTHAYYALQDMLMENDWQDTDLPLRW